MLQRYMTAQGTRKWIVALPQIVENYNNKPPADPDPKKIEAITWS